MKKGVVVWFDKRKGYGFIRRTGGKDIFMHTKLMPCNGHINPGDTVQFSDSTEHRGLAASVRVTKHNNVIYDRRLS